MNKFWLTFVGVFGIGTCVSGGAFAQIVVGQTAGFTGAVAATVKEATDGAKLYIDSVNAKGGVNGQQIELVSLDDKFDPKLAAANARTLITEKGAVALFLTRGTPHAELIIPILDEFKVPLIAPSTGAMLLHTPVRRYVFNVRSTYQREAAKGVSLLASIGITSIGVLHVDDTFGADGLMGIQSGFETAALKPAFIGKYDRTKPDFTAFVADVKRSNPQAVFIVGSGTAVADAQKAVRAAGSRAQIVTLSNNASGGFIKGLGENAPGTIVTQVFPNERSIASPLAKEALTLAKAKQLGELSPAMLEGFAAAKVLVEGLRRAGANATGEKLRNALEGIRGFDIGGMDISYSASDHTGLDFVDLSIINKDGKFTR
jgi:ABC-type branched-subunit amino acid transport system substrate-binding protein